MTCVSHVKHGSVRIFKAYVRLLVKRNILRNTSRGSRFMPFCKTLPWSKKPYHIHTFQKSTVILMDIHDFWMSVFNSSYKRGYPHWYPSRDIHAWTFYNGCPWNINIHEWISIFSQTDIYTGTTRFKLKTFWLNWKIFGTNNVHTFKKHLSKLKQKCVIFCTS